MHKQLKGSVSFAEHAAAFKDDINAQEKVQHKVDLINKAYDAKKKLKLDPLKKPSNHSQKVESKSRKAKNVSQNIIDQTFFF